MVQGGSRLAGWQHVAHISRERDIFHSIVGLSPGTESPNRTFGRLLDAVYQKNPVIMGNFLENKPVTGRLTMPLLFIKQGSFRKFPLFSTSALLSCAEYPADTTCRPMPGLSHEQGAPSRNARCTAIARIMAPPAMGPAPQRRASRQRDIRPRITGRATQPVDRGITRVETDLGQSGTGGDRNRPREGPSLHARSRSSSSPCGGDAPRA